MNQRRTVSFLLPIVGLVVTASELQRLLEARRVAEACLAQAPSDPGSCAVAPDMLFFVIAGLFGVIFVARLVYLAVEYFRSPH
jgi:tellurite resistance protein TehA-like permease